MRPGIVVWEPSGIRVSPTCMNPSDIPLPKSWPEYTRVAFVHATALARMVLMASASWAYHGPDSERIKLRARNAELENENALLREELRIKDARWDRTPPARRPHYPPVERFAILLVQAARGWSNAQTARVFRIGAQRIATWRKWLAESKERLIRTAEPVNRYCDYVTQVFQDLKAKHPTISRRRAAQWLARAGLYAAASTIERAWKREPVEPPTKGPSPEPPTSHNGDGADAAKKKRIVARYPGHTLNVDITVVPMLGGYWVPWIPYALAPLWPWTWHVVAVVDHYSRRLVAIQAFKQAPCGMEVCDVLDVALGVMGKKPKHIISDQGSQFKEDYTDWCDAHRIQPRFGKVGEHGSIALIERFFKTLKYEGLFHIRLPASLVLMQEEVIVFGRWYNSERPHSSLRGASPDDIFFGTVPARRVGRIEPRARYPSRGARRVPAERLRLVTNGFEGRAHLEVVRLEVSEAA